MHILINAVSLRAAGGRSVGLNFLKSFKAVANGDTAVAYVPIDCGYETLQSKQLKINPLPQWQTSFPSRLWLDHVVFPRQMAWEKADVIFSMGNIALPSEQPQVVLFMWPYAIYPESIVWRRMKLSDKLIHSAKLRIFSKRLQYANIVAAQTKTARQRLLDIYNLAEERVKVVPTAVTESFDIEGPLDTEVDSISADIKLFCLTRYYPHKNLEVFLELAKLIKAEKKRIVVILTISDLQHPNAKTLLQELKHKGLEDVLVNIGPVPMARVPSLYRSTDALILPTLLESFSQTYVEAMYFKRPILTSDYDFAHDVCGDCAAYFNPLDAEDIFDKIQIVFNSESLQRQMVERGFERVNSFPSGTEVAKQYFDLLHVTAGQ